MAQKTISAKRRLLNGRYVMPLHGPLAQSNTPITYPSHIYAPDHFQGMLDDCDRQMRPVVD